MSNPFFIAAGTKSQLAVISEHFYSGEFYNVFKGHYRETRISLE